MTYRAPFLVGSALILAAAAAVVLAILALTAVASPPCRRGVSSIGPVAIVHGRLVGDTTPRTEECLP